MLFIRIAFLSVGLSLLLSSSFACTGLNKRPVKNSKNPTGITSPIQHRHDVLGAEIAAPLTMSDPNMDDSNRLEKEMDPNPTLNEGRQILDVY